MTTVIAGGRAWSQLRAGGEWFEVDPAEAAAKYKRLLWQWRWQQRERGLQRQWEEIRRWLRRRLSLGLWRWV
jgi:hypothetical protein